MAARRLIGLRPLQLALLLLLVLLRLQAADGFLLPSLGSSRCRGSTVHRGLGDGVSGSSSGGSERPGFHCPRLRPFALTRRRALDDGSDDGGDEPPRGPRRRRPTTPSSRRSSRPEGGEAGAGKKGGIYSVRGGAGGGGGGDGEEEEAEEDDNDYWAMRPAALDRPRQQPVRRPGKDRARNGFAEVGDQPNHMTRPSYAVHALQRCARTASPSASPGSRRA